MLSKWLVLNNCPVSGINSLKMRPAWRQAWAARSPNPENFTKPPRRSTGDSWQQREKSRGIPVCLGGKEPSQKFREGVVLRPFVSYAVLEAEDSSK